MSHASGLAAWLRLTLVRGIGGETQRRLLAAHGLPEQIFSSSVASLARTISAQQAEQLLSAQIDAQIEAALDWAAQPNHHLVTLADAAYPQKLLETPDPPTILYARGRIELLNAPSLAVVGSRNASAQGQANAESFSASLSAAGLTIVSGLALGIDTAAHRGGLRGTGSTLAVVGTGIDRVYPARNLALAREIGEAGLIISEFPLQTPALKENFPRRNRLISGLGLACLVVEAAERSGSLITARLAADQGRDVFAIPGSIHSPLAKGCHRLIKQGAKLVDDVNDILDELEWKRAVPPAQSDDPATPGDVAGWIDCLDDGPCDMETLILRSGLTPEALYAILLEWELKGQVARLPGGRFQRVVRG